MTAAVQLKSNVSAYAIHRKDPCGAEREVNKIQCGCKDKCGCFYEALSFMQTLQNCFSNEKWHYVLHHLI